MRNRCIHYYRFRTYTIIYMYVYRERMFISTRVVATRDARAGSSAVSVVSTPRDADGNCVRDIFVE